MNMSRQPERRAHLVAQELADALAAHAPHDLTDEEAERHGVVAAVGPRLPAGVLLLDPVDHALPVEEVRTVHAVRAPAPCPAWCVSRW